MTVDFGKLFGVLVGFLVSLLKLFFSGLGAGLFVLGLCVCGCSFKAQGGSSGSVGVAPYEIVNWDETHNVKASADSPALSKVLEAVVAGDGD